MEGYFQCFCFTQNLAKIQVYTIHILILAGMQIWLGIGKSGCMFMCAKFCLEVQLLCEQN